MAIKHFASLIPFLTAIVVAFGILQLYSAVTFAADGQFAFAVFYGVFSFAGFALARALWINRRKFDAGK